MNHSQENKKNAVQYLFGELAESELDSFEERLFTDEDFSLFLDDVENDLIDGYIRGELEFEEKRNFETKYLISESRRERVNLGRTLNTEVFENEKKTVISLAEKTPFGQFIKDFFRMPNLALTGGLAAIILLVLIGGIFLITQQGGNQEIVGANNSNIMENPTPIQEDPTPEISPKPEENPSEDNQTNTNNSSEINKNDSDTNTKSTSTPQKASSNKPEKKPTPKPVNKQRKTVPQPPRVFAVSLLPPLRSSQTPVLNIPASAQTVRIQLFDNFGQKYEKFIIELNGGSGNIIWSQEVKASKKRPQKSIMINVPNSQFKSGNYEIAVSGVTKEGSVEEINFYNFVVKKGKDERE
jgi:outer membrane biosynthesis protein TonB